jgi:ATP-binding cassette subfamily B (MDR/TAP) protein 1
MNFECPLETPNELYCRYPTRPDVKVCDGYTFKVPAGSTLALCGESGSGKSTAIQLTERFYDPTAGSVKVDGRPLETYNARWLRTQVPTPTRVH